MQHCIILNANKAVGCGIFHRFSNLDKCRSKAAGDIIPACVWPVVLDKCINFHDPKRNSTRSRQRRYFPYNFRPEVDNDVISGAAVDNVRMDVPVKLGDSKSNAF